jgi:endonuclease-3
MPDAQDRKRKPFDIDLALERVARAVAPYPKAALFELADEGYRSLFEQLAACLISIRTLDETTVVIARRLFGRARTPKAVMDLPPGALETLLHGCTFHEIGWRSTGCWSRSASISARGRYPAARPAPCWRCATKWA